jgi:hypothetical protein
MCALGVVCISVGAVIPLTLIVHWSRGQKFVEVLLYIFSEHPGIFLQ